MEAEDLIQIGTVGMLKAIRGFDPRKECRFTTYAVPLIMGEIKRFLRDDGWIKVGREIKQTAVRIFRFTESFEKTEGRSPTVPEICEGLGLDEEKAALALASARPALSLYAEDEETGFSPESVLGDDPTEEIMGKISLREAVDALPREERMLICLRYFRHMTQSQTAQVMGITQVKVSREEKKILQKLKAALVS